MSWMLYFLGFIGILIIFFFLKWYMVRPLKIKLENLDSLKIYFDELFLRYESGTIAIIDQKSSSKFLQFVVHCERENRKYLHFSFPDSPWSRPYFDNVKLALKASDLDFSIKKTGRNDTKAFVDLDGIASTEEALNITKTVAKAIGIAKANDLRIQVIGNFSPEEIERTFKKLKKAWKARRERK